jgi:hypothetical protein
MQLPEGVRVGCAAPLAACPACCLLVRWQELMNASNHYAAVFNRALVCMGVYFFKGFRIFWGFVGFGG